MAQSYVLLLGATGRLMEPDGVAISPTFYVYDASRHGVQRDFTAWVLLAAVRYPLLS